MRLHVDKLQLSAVVEALEEYQGNHIAEWTQERASGVEMILTLAKALLDWTEKKAQCETALREYNEYVHEGKAADDENFLPFG